MLSVRNQAGYVHTCHAPTLVSTNSFELRGFSGVCYTWRPRPMVGVAQW